jgi:signal transduction histidine kinase
MKSLAWKIGGALVLVALITVAVMAGLTNAGTNREFQSYTDTNPAFAETVSRTLAVVYSTNRGSWTGLADVLPQLLAFEGDRLVVADVSGTIVGDTSDVLVGQSVGEADLTGGYPIQSMMGIAGGGGGFGGGARPSLGEFFYLGQGGGILDAEEIFLEQTNRWLWLSGGIAIAIALGLAVMLALNFIRPLKALNAGANQIAAGNLGHRVEVKSTDETGRLAASFNAMAGSLQKSEDARKRLLADVAHELRTPLTVINGTVDAMADGVLPCDQRQLGIIKGETIILTRLIADLRDLSLAEAGKLKLELADIDLADLARRKLDQFRPLAEAKGITLGVDAPADLPPVAADWVRLEQVFANLLSNAIRHTPEGGRITISLRASELDSKPALIAAVADTGEGMAADRMEHIFDRFYRIEDSRARSEGNGAGLGLAIVRQMVAAHGGEVRVESQPAKGSTFFVTLPAAGKH